MNERLAEILGAAYPDRAARMLREIEIRRWRITPLAIGSGLACSFCQRAQSEVKKLVAAPTVYICDRCAEHAFAALNDDARPEADAILADAVRALTGVDEALIVEVGRILAASEPSTDDVCGFCGRTVRSDGARMIEGPRTRICDECLALVRDIVAEDVR